MRLRFVADAAAGIIGDDDLAAVPGRQPNGRLVDLRRQHLLRAAGPQRHPRPPRSALSRETCGLSTGDGPAGEAGPRQRRAEQPPQRALSGRALVVRLDVVPAVVDEVRVVHARRAGRHEAAVDVPRHLLRRVPIALQHLLHQVDAAARAVQFVAQQHVGRARRRAEPAMDAVAQDLPGLPDVEIRELREGEFALIGKAGRSYQAPR